MKMAKSYKILFLIATCVLSIVLGLCTLNFKTTNAETISFKDSLVSEYFNTTLCNDAEIKDGKASFTVGSGNEVSIKNKLVIDDFKMELNFSKAEVDKIMIKLEYESYYVNGNKNAEGKFDTKIIHEYTLTGTELEDDGKDGVKTVSVKVDNDGYVYIGKQAKNEYFRIRKVDKASAKVSFSAILNSGYTESTISLVYVNQDGADDNSVHKQTFVVTDNELDAAVPMVSVNAPFYVRTQDENTGKISYQIKAYKGDLTAYSLTYEVFSVIGNVSSSDLYPTTTDASLINIPKNEDNVNYDKLYFTLSNATSAKFNVCYKEGDEDVACSKDGYTVTLLDKLDETSNDNTAPEYVYDALAVEAFNAALKDAYMKDEDNFVALGSNVSIPSLEDLIVDDRTPYGKLNKTLYYLCSEPLASSSSLEIRLNVLGDYKFYVVVGDNEGKSMDKDKEFIKFDDDGIPDASAHEKYEQFVFGFSILKDAAISIEAPENGTGYVGTRFTASKFDIKAVNAEEKYSLWFNPNKLNATIDDKGWVEIKKVADVGEGYSDKNGYTYESLKSIDYDGQYVFTPNKAGTYMIKCTVTSEVSFREVEDYAYITISGNPKIVKPANHWLKDNVWSIVFLSVGSVCLVAVVVLLCIKPKDKVSEEE